MDKVQAVWIAILFWLQYTIMTTELFFLWKFKTFFVSNEWDDLSSIIQLQLLACALIVFFDNENFNCNKNFFQISIVSQDFVYKNRIIELLYFFSILVVCLIIEQPDVQQMHVWKE
jgi:hypothetical protein